MIPAVAALLAALVLAVVGVVVTESGMRAERAEVEARLADIEAALADPELAWARSFRARRQLLERRIVLLTSLSGATTSQVAILRRTEPVLSAEAEIVSFHVERRECFVDLAAPDLTSIVRGAEAVARLEGVRDVEINDPRRGEDGFTAQLFFVAGNPEGGR